MRISGNKLRGDVSLLGRSVRLDDASADTHLTRQRGWGFNLLRVPFKCGALEHEWPEICDNEYMDYLIQVLSSPELGPNSTPSRLSHSLDSSLEKATKVKYLFLDDITGWIGDILSTSTIRLFNAIAANVSPRAVHDSLKPTIRPRCHPNTRQGVLHRLEAWQNRMADADPEAVLLWLKGDEGTGKSAIAETDPTRNHVGTIVASIAHQLSVVQPTTRTAVANAVRLNNQIYQRSLEKQLHELVAQPLLQVANSSTPHIIVIDALDHCIDPNAQSRLVHALLPFASLMNEHNIPIRILITGRPTPHLTMTFSRTSLSKLSCVVLEDHDASNDIHHFLEEKLEELRLYHPLKSQISAILARASCA
ncbi:hypothetical protein CPB83DRAFT_890160 [Crepidotus variabilis]|uniref:Nephrocystin 3-like N-terminal domain-containing protein n=1 Tax=Crepidotus variabilis TaxID=179855 RepID=A0A9P6ERM8_9AGAR|nr:hypothetical protein CPB83DRAFT_890160 [Crepidotus variabilis]